MGDTSEACRFGRILVPLFADELEDSKAYCPKTNLFFVGQMIVWWMLMYYSGLMCFGAPYREFSDHLLF
jgi:hypothetical protein